MKRTIEIKRDYNIVKNVGIEIGLVSGLSKGQHTHEFQIFPLKDSVSEIGLVGVKDQTFALSFKPNFYGRFAVAVYLDGINAYQGSGINSLNSIHEYWRHIIKVHKGRFLFENENKRVSYLNRYYQQNGENRSFKFTSKRDSGINEILISDPSLNNRIDVYVWKEYDDEYDYDVDYLLGDGLINSKVGAGKATNTGFKKVAPLNNPTFLGKATFIHQPAEKLKHLGKSIITIKIPDPMDQIPRS